jgi:hypothetical protein
MDRGYHAPMCWLPRRVNIRSSLRRSPNTASPSFYAVTIRFSTIFRADGRVRDGPVTGPINTRICRIRAIYETISCVIIVSCNYSNRPSTLGAENDFKNNINNISTKTFLYVYIYRSILDAYNYAYS